MVIVHTELSCTWKEGVTINTAVCSELDSHSYPLTPTLTQTHPHRLIELYRNCLNQANCVQILLDRIINGYTTYVLVKNEYPNDKQRLSGLVHVRSAIRKGGIGPACRCPPSPPWTLIYKWYSVPPIKQVPVYNPACTYRNITLRSVIDKMV